MTKSLKLHLEQFKSTKFHIDKGLYKKAKYHAVELILQRKIKRKYWKSKELWKTLRSLG